jgi:rhodanese-related sulfurtransferase
VAQLLLDNGFKNVRALKGGWDAWQAGGGQVEPKEQPKK